MGVPPPPLPPPRVPTKLDNQESAGYIYLAHIQQSLVGVTKSPRYEGKPLKYSSCTNILAEFWHFLEKLEYFSYFCD